MSGKRARTTCLVVVLSWLAGTVSAADRDVDANAIRKAVGRALPLLEQSAATYIEKRDCFSCHHQALPAVTLARARTAGFKVDRERARDQSEFTQAYFAGRRKRVRAGEGVPGGAYTAGYALWSLAADGFEPDEVTADMVSYLHHKHQADGSWRIHTHRPPLEDSDFTATALSLKGLQLFAGKDQAEDLAERTRRARGWLLKAEPKTNEDRVFRLLGLKWAGADRKDIKRPGRKLLKRQRDDGGWSQLDEMTSDAYATGQALYALKTAAVLDPDDKAFRRGVVYLLKAQQADGSWKVTTRSKAIQKFFESGFPHGKSQFISTCGTCWATMALLEALLAGR